MPEMPTHFRFPRRPKSDRRNHPTGRGFRSVLRLTLLVAVAMIAMTEGSSAQTTISIDHFGAGNAFRPGGSTAVRIRIQSDLDEPVPGIVQWETINGDGDTVVNSRRLAIPARGGQAVTWLIAELPSRSSAADLLRTIWTFRLFEFEDGVRTREISVARIDPGAALNIPRPVEQTQALAMVIGRNNAGLGGFDRVRGFAMRPGMNEETIVVANVEPGELPDAAAGLSPYELIVWAANDQRFLPSSIDNKPSIEAALRGWLERGGHLVILLPATSDPWRLGRNETVFGELMKGLVAIREDGIPLRDLLPALSDRASLRDAARLQPMHRFDPETLPAEWRALAAVMPPKAARTSPDSDDATAIVARRLQAAAEADSEPILYAVRRDVGQGILDVVGIDVADPDLRLQQAGGLPKTSIFWNDLLGRRAFTASGPTLEALKTDRRLVTRPSIDNLGAGEVISRSVGLTSGAVGGVLGGFVLFAIYWAVAGPIGFAVLTKLGRRRLAWLAFAATTVVFSVIAWTTSRASSGGPIEMRHVTMLRHLYRPEGAVNESPQFDLARTWFSARLPGYGLVPVELGGDAVAGNRLDQFSPPPNGLAQQFPNTDRYEIRFDEADRQLVPARATSAEFVADWMGRPAPADDAWRSTLKVKLDDPVRLERHAGEQISLHGTIVNATGLALEDIYVLVVFPRRTPTSFLPDDAPDTTLPVVLDDPPNYGAFVALANRIGPGDELNLRTILEDTGRPVSERLRGKRSLATQIRNTFLEPASAAAADGFNAIAMGNAGLRLTDVERRRYLRMLSMFHMLPPPRLEVKENAGAVGAVAFHRWLARGMDTSTRFSEPGVFVFAAVSDAPCPVPISIDGTRVAGEGLVMLQWVHPLPPVLEQLARPAFRAEDEAAPTSAANEVSLDARNGVASTWR
ncbi:MAG: hypothetical protein CMJ54_07865 [Planctomycetaceae bacterium]|nr:hypothetical protein [Planctomycetaceae bacterium]